MLFQRLATAVLRPQGQRVLLKNKPRLVSQFFARQAAPRTSLARLLALGLSGSVVAAVALWGVDFLRPSEKVLLAKAKQPVLEPPKPEITQVTEPSTGITFPSHMAADGGGFLRLLGCGCRKKYGIAKIYAVAVYVNAKPSGSSGEALLEDLISSPSLTRGIVLKMYREVGPDQLVEALETSLKPRLTLADPSKPASPEALESVAKMKALLMSLFGPRIKVGTEIVFVISNSAATLRVAVVGAGPPQAISPAPQLCRALLDCYVGRHAVAPELRVSAAKALEKI